MSIARKTTEYLLPIDIKGREPLEENGYDMYPYHSLASGHIYQGGESLAEWISTQKTVAIDGFQGNDWNDLQLRLDTVLQAKGIKVQWFFAADFFRSEIEIEEMVCPFLGEQDSVWGKKTTLSLVDFFDKKAIDSILWEKDALKIVIGVGASLILKAAPVVYVDLPKNELQFRMRAGAAGNLGFGGTQDAAKTYKRFYFVDWVVLNNYKEKLLPSIKIVADGQWTPDLTWSYFDDIQKGVSEMAENVFRVRPWFEPGIWGGKWMQQRIQGLNANAVNYAWSFEMIVPENGLVFESDGILLELAFDWLMLLQSEKVLGKKDTLRFGAEFPIRFDFLDTFDGDNLSIQCHPSLSYIQRNFGERLTQDETYYILDCASDADVYLGFQDNIDPIAFRNVLENSKENGVPIHVEDYVQRFSVQRHDLFLIPNKTIHCSGKNNLVLEISSTPYIFTFKMYDWLRLDLNGKPRPINIEHAFQNLDFSRKGAVVKETLISKPEIIDRGEDWELIHLPTHSEHFYDVHRIEFAKSVNVETSDKCHVLMLVEGSSIIIETKNGTRRRFHFAETFAIPAAAGTYTIINEGGTIVKVIKAFVK